MVFDLTVIIVIVISSVFIYVDRVGMFLTGGIPGASCKRRKERCE